jgi:cytochrome c peroxidase
MYRQLSDHCCRLLVSLVLCATLLLVAVGDTGAQQTETDLADSHGWTPAEKKLLATLSIEKSRKLPPDPSNAVADNPLAARLGRQLFFDARMSVNGKVACATCHQPSLYFTDGLALANGVGLTRRHAMTLTGAAYNLWFFWDGRKDSQWSQALGPLENSVEHGSNRNRIAHLLQEDPLYHQQYEAIFGLFPDISDAVRFPVAAGPVDDPQIHKVWDNMSDADKDIINRIFANVGKTIAAYERLLMPAPARIDNYIKAVIAGDSSAMETSYTPAEANGLRLFIGKAQCINCHNGPLLSNYSFHNTGIRPAAGEDTGRLEGVVGVKQDPFNCLGSYSDARPEQCTHLRFLRATGSGLFRAFKTPGLRNIAQTAPYMHDGQMKTLTEVLAHYNFARSLNGRVPEIVPLKLKSSELTDLEAFLNTLTGKLPASDAGN